jgi:hypothetical protein
MTTGTPAKDPISSLTAAQQAADAVSINLMTASEPTLHGWSPALVKFLAVSIIAFTLAALCLCTVLLWRSRATGFHVLRIFGVITILGISALLLIVGYSNEQLTPIVGLFGAIAGYLLGKDTTSSSATSPSVAQIPSEK